MTTDGFELETEFSYGLLAAPQSVVEPLSLASVKRAMERGGAGYLWFSLDSPECFQSTEEPKLRDDIRLELLADGRFATTLATGQAVDADDEEEENETSQDDVRKLLAPLLRSYRCGDLRIEGDAYFDDRFVAQIPVPARIKTVEQALHIGEHATALLHDAELGELTRQGAVDLVRAGYVRTLLERAEGTWLEGKSKPYRLSEDPQRWELAKDVASFANAEAGGLIVIGVRTERVLGGDMIVSVREIPLELIDAESYRKSIRRRIRPIIEGLEVRTVDHGSGRGVAFIHVPPQADDLKPFVVEGVLRRDRIDTTYVSVPVRDGEGTAIAHVSDIQELLRAGRAAMQRGARVDY